jgi:sugar phosphate isomerase/epimerase
MKIGLLTGPLGDRDRRAAFIAAAELGFEAVELGTGEFTTDFHADLARLAAEEAARRDLRRDLDEAGVSLAALSCHGNPLHPNAEYAARADRVFRETVDVAAAMGVDAVNVFSGCPGDPDGGDYPNWIVSTWPEYFGELLEWQWREVVIPYWTQAAAYAGLRGVRIAIEMHPGNVVFNVETLLRLRAAVGAGIGANFDPSHLWWQGMEPLVALRAVGEAGALFNVHAKDTHLDLAEVARTGVLAPGSTPGSKLPWQFTTLGHGHGLTFWRQFVNELRSLGWDGALCVEHEDELAPALEALTRSVEVLKAARWSDSSMGLPWLEAHDPPFPSPDRPSTNGMFQGEADARS